MGEHESSYQDYCNTITQYAGCMDDYPYVVDIKADRYFISAKAVDRFAMKENEFTGVLERHKDFVWAEDYQLLVDDISPVMEGKRDMHDIRYRWIGKNGKPLWIHCKGRLVRDENGNPKFLIGCVNEIGERQTADNITGLRQTGAIEEELDCGNFPKGFFMRLGLDGFKNVVERLGMEFGDQVLRDVAECIRHSLSPNERVFRAISDEFLLVDFNGGDRSEAMRLYRRIRATVDFYIDAHDYESVFTVSGGMILTDEVEDQNYEEVMKLSRFALNMAKNRGRNQLYMFNADEYEDFLHKRDLNIALRQAVANDFEGFELYYQPITNAADGRLYGAESLCRFFHNGKMVSPVEFVPILEETGLIIPVGRWIMDQACMTLKACREILPEFRLSVNLSYVQIIKSGVTDDLTRSLKNLGMTAEGLTVELTESGYLEKTPVIEHVINHLKDHGVHIAIDDFGTGYSNMHYLDRIKPHTIKIDRSFTVEALTREYARRLLANIIDMAHSMDMRVVIEGIETVEELLSIQELSPDYIQGYYYGKPCSRENFMKEHVRS